MWRHLFKTWGVSWSWGYILFCMELPYWLIGISICPPTWVIHLPMFKIIFCIPYRVEYPRGLHRVTMLG